MNKKWRDYAKTVDGLKKWLDEHSDLPGDTPVILEKDAEGNGYSPLSNMDTGWYAPESTWSGEVSDRQTGPDSVRCVVLGPVN